MDILLETTQDGSCNQQESFNGKVANPPTTPSTIPTTPSASPKPPTTQPARTASPVQERELVDDETNKDQATNAHFESGKVETTSSPIRPTSKPTTLKEERSSQDVREVDLIPATHLQPIQSERSGDNVERKKPLNSDGRDRLEPSREVTFAPSTHSLRGEKPEDNEVPVVESNEIDRTTNNEEADTKFGLKGTSVLKLEGNEMSLDEFENGFKDSAGGEKKGEPKNPLADRGKFQSGIRKEVMKRPTHDPQEKNDSQEVDKGPLVSQELLERSGEGGRDYNENQVKLEEEINEGKRERQIEKNMMNTPIYIEVPRVIPHKSLNIIFVGFQGLEAQTIKRKTVEKPTSKNITVIKHAKEEMTVEDFKKKYPEMIKEDSVKKDDLVVNLPLGHELYNTGVGKLPDSKKGKEKRKPKEN